MRIKTVAVGVVITVLSVALAMGLSYVVTSAQHVELTLATPENPLDSTQGAVPTSGRPFGPNETPAPLSSYDCTFPIQIWLEHPSAWRISSYRISDRLYSKDDMREMMLSTPTDTRGKLLVQIFVTVLNQQNGADATVIRIPFNEALSWLRNFPPGVTPSDGDLQKAELITATLASFNNGQSGTPVCAYNLAEITPDLRVTEFITTPTATFYRSIITRVPPTRTREPQSPKPTRAVTRVSPTATTKPPEPTSEATPTDIPTQPPPPTDPPPPPTDEPVPTVGATDVPPTLGAPQQPAPTVMPTKKGKKK